MKAIISSLKTLIVQAILWLFYRLAPKVRKPLHYAGLHYWTPWETSRNGYFPEGAGIDFQKRRCRLCPAVERRVIGKEG